MLIYLQDMVMKDLNSLNNQELKDFFNSFDNILSDIDGVLWHCLEKIPGSEEGVRSLRKLGKRMVLVSNNSTRTPDFLHQQLISANFHFDKDDLVSPILPMIYYLEKHNVTKDIFVIGMPPLKQALQKAGFKLAESGPHFVKETVQDFAEAAIPGETVGAVISDVDFNVNYVNLQRATIFLEKPEVLFLVGATDIQIPVSKSRWLLGPGIFHKILEDMTGRSGVKMAKPSPFLSEYLAEKYKIEDPSRVLFIGDSVPEDMGFATQSGYKKLLVLSGLTTEDSLKNWTFPEEYKPDYYVDNLHTIHDLILRVFGNL